MKAILLKEYGPPKTLSIEEIPKPVPNEDEVLVKVHAVSINDWDWGLVRGKPFVIRLFFGLTKPKISIPGVDISGKIEAVGADVTSFAIGDEIYSDLSDCGLGGFAEYVCVPEKEVYKKPPLLSHREAAALPHASILALQGLVEKGEVRSGQQVLINGAGGGVGTLGIQILKEYDVTVTGVDSAEKLELMTSLGHDHVLDYRETDFTATRDTFDLILDAKTNRSVFHYVRALKKNGRYVTVGGSMPRLFQIAVLGPLIKLFTGKTLSVLALQPNEGLNRISDLAENGQLKPVIDGPYPFEQIPELIQYFGEAKHQGKIVVDVLE